MTLEVGTAEIEVPEEVRSGVFGVMREGYEGKFEGGFHGSKGEFVKILNRHSGWLVVERANAEVGLVPEKIVDEGSSDGAESRRLGWVAAWKRAKTGEAAKSKDEEQSKGTSSKKKSNKEQRRLEMEQEAA